MNSNFSGQNSPLSRFLEDDTLTIMETVIPYCHPPLAKVLAVQMKLLEIRKIMDGFEDESRLQACGFEDSPVDVEAVLRSLRNSVSGEKAQQIDSILNFIRFSRMYQNWQETMQSHPELMQLLSQSFSSGNRNPGDNNSDEKGAGSGNPLADPSLFMMLNSAMNRGDSHSANGSSDDGGHGNERMQMLLNLAMKNQNGNADLGDMVSALMKKPSN